jgi:hypothetical protein
LNNHYLNAAFQVSERPGPKHLVYIVLKGTLQYNKIAKCIPILIECFHWILSEFISLTQYLPNAKLVKSKLMNSLVTEQGLMNCTHILYKYYLILFFI